MKIVVIGGTGLVGSKLVAKLRVAGHEVVAASPSSGVNTMTGEGVAEVVAGARVVVDVSNSPSFEDEAVMGFFKTSGRILLSAETGARVKHHVALSVVGTDPLSESGYLRAKAAQEHLIRNSGIPYTIIHSTQFFEFLGGIAQSGTDGQNVRLSPAYVQPIASEDVATMMAEYVLGEPVNGVVEIAGPQKFPLSDLVAKFLSATKDPRQVTPDVRARYFGAELNDRTLMPRFNPRLGSIPFETWVSRSSTAAHQ